MNPRLIGKIIGGALIAEAGFMLLPLFVSYCYSENLRPFVLSILLAALLGLVLVKISDKDQDLVSREGLISTGLTWIVLSLVGMCPFLLSGAIKDPMEALFETVSGFTTTGATILTDVESLPRGVLAWRSLMHWIGGMGILVFMAAIMHFSGGSQMNLVRAESTGPIISKLVPKAGGTAQVLYAIYAFMTVIVFMVLMVLRMPVFDAMCLSFGCAGTGGFAVLNDSCASYTIAQQAALNISCIAFGVSFTVYFLILAGKAKIALKGEEVRAYFLLILAASAAITVDLIIQDRAQFGNINPLYIFHRAAFMVGNTITTTGAAIEDCNSWPMFTQCVILLLMICGACAGSTGGGFKVSRIIIMMKAFNKEMAVHLRPDLIKKIHMDGKPVEESTVRNIGTYCFLGCFIMVISLLLLSFDRKGWIDTISAVVSTFNNAGPGFGINGTMGNYHEFSGFSKLVLSADMLIGRLEIYPILTLFKRNTWRRF